MWFRHFITLFIGLFLAPINWACIEQLQLDGDFIQGGLVHGRVKPIDTRVYLNGIEALIHEDGRFLLGFDRDASTQMTLRVVGINQQDCVRVIQVQKRQYNIQRIDGLPNEQVHPDRDALIRIRTESAQVKAARALLDARVDYRAGFVGL